METKRPQAEVGVIVGRFQTHKLHESHIDLIQTVIDRHDKVLIFLGLSPIKATWNNPLDFESRRVMIAEKFSKVTILYVKDQESDALWSKKLDTMIKDNIAPHHKVILYGGRDSFISHYKGVFPTEELESTRIFSSTEIRNKLSTKIKDSPDFRAGVIWATQQIYPSVKPTVDIVILNENETEILVGKKQDEDKYRFIGGFADPIKDKSYEDAAKREGREETALELSSPVYVGSMFVDDWRYRREKDKIFTILFKCKKLFGHPEALDDIEEVRWIPLDATSINMIMDVHLELFTMLLSNVYKYDKCSETVDNDK